MKGKRETKREKKEKEREREKVKEKPFVKEENDRGVFEPHTIDNLLEQLEGLLHSVDPSLFIESQVVLTQRSKEDDRRHLKQEREREREREVH